MRKINELHDSAWLNARLAAGDTTRSIAANLGCSTTAVERAIKRIDAKAPSETRRETAVQLIQEGASTQRIVDETGYSASGVWLLKKSLGVAVSRTVPQLNDRAFLEDAAQRHDTYIAVANEIGCAANSVKQAFRRNDIKFERKPPLKSLFPFGTTEARDIAQATGFSLVHVQQVLSAMGFKNSKNKSGPEKELRKSFKNVEAQYNVRGLGGNYELDVFFPEHKIAVELDGYYWHAEGVHRDKYNILNKHELAKSAGVRSIHILDVEWIHQRSIVENIINTALGRYTTRLFARKCEVTSVSSRQAKDFCEENHIQGHAPAKLYVGLKYDGELVGLMTFGKARYNKEAGTELLRLCFKSGVSVVGGAEKMLAYALGNNELGVIVSYCDRRLFSGNVYTKLGFEYSHTTSPGYYYIRNSGPKQNRVNFQKHKLQQVLDKFEPTLSEFENMRANGYHRVWDAGHDVYLLRRTM